MIAPRDRTGSAFWPLLILGLLAAAGCGRRPPAPVAVKPSPPPAPPGSPGGKYSIDLFKAEPRAGTAVVLLVDTSGSMGQAVRDRSGQSRPKNDIAREALEHIIEHTGKWKKGHPEANLQMALYSFSSSVHEALPMGEFNPDKARAAVKRLPRPNSGTAIGRSLEAAFKALYRSGCARKFVVCVTDGENTSGPDPAWVSQHLFQLTSGEVEMQFVAFDISAQQFQFLKEVNGDVVEASDGAKLQEELTKIYDTRILVEKEEVPEKK